MSALTRAQTYFVDEDECIALVGPVMVVVARKEPSTDITRQADVCVSALERKYHGNSALLVIVKSDVRPPSDEGRERIRGAMKACERSMRVGAIVVEGQGFIATATRSAITMMLFVVRTNFPVKVFSVVDDAAEHICSALMAHDLTPSGLLQAIRDLRTAYDAGSLRGSHR